MLVLLFSQALSGLFNSDEVFYSGPLYYWASGELRDAMGAWHEIGFNALLTMVCLHLLAIAYYQLRKRQPLLRAMLLGRASGRSGRSAAVSLWRALLLLLAVVGMLWVVVALAPQPPPMW